MDIKLPELGEGIESGDVLEVLVREGDTIKKDQGIVELETDKATMAVPSPEAGRVTKIHVGEGDTLKVGALLISIEATSAAAEKPAPAPKSELKQDSKPQPQQTTKHVEATPAESKPVDTPTPVHTVAPNKTAQPVRAESPSRTEIETVAQPSSSSVSAEQIPAGPAIRKFAREVGVDLAKVTGTGPDGRITREDILAVVRHSSYASTQSKPAGRSPSPETATDNWGSVRLEKMSKIRRTIAEKMHQSWTTCPRVTNFDDADVTDLEEFRQHSKADYAAQGIKLTSMPFIIKAVAMSLKSNPTINASIDMEAGQIIYKEYINVGIAIDSERGLVVPSLRNVDKMSIPDIARELDAMVERVRSGTFTVEELRGGTFSISNLGAIGGTYSTPIINYPETAILLIGRSRKMPIVVGDKIVPRLMMPLSLSYDHRLIDGATAARFLNTIIGFLSAPSRILLAP